MDPTLAVPAGPTSGPDRRATLAALAPRVLAAFVHSLLALPAGIGLFTIAITGVSLGMGLIPLALVGLVVLAATLMALQRAARWERDRARRLLGTEVSEPPVSTGRGRAALLATVRDPASWRAVAYALVLLPWGITAFTVVVVMWVGGLGYSSFALWWWTLRNVDSQPLGWHAGHWIDVLPVTLAGLLLLAFAAPVTLLVGRISSYLVCVLLGPTGALRDELVARLTRSRRDAVDAAVAERRRIERDLHDGAQQRLVALALTLGRAEQAYGEGGDDADTARMLVSQARGETKEVLRELRDLVRGLSPAVLADRGLDAAVAGLAARAPVPVTVTIDPELTRVRPDRAVEEAAYFVISEALTNVARHARATAAAVVVQRRRGVLTVTVSDDGVGAAIARHDGGLEGLSARVAALDGAVTIDSPSGGPTVLRAVVPL